VRRREVRESLLLLLSLALEATRLRVGQLNAIKDLIEGRQDMNMATQISTADQLRGATRIPEWFVSRD
jgi:hypothetical protein